MIAGSLITLREGMEAFLIVGLLPGAVLGLALAGHRTYAAYMLIFGGQFIQAMREGVPRRELRGG